MCHTGYANAIILKDMEPNTERIGMLRDKCHVPRFKIIYNTEEKRKECHKLYGMTPEEIDDYMVRLR